ncbi:28S ribosomal protein S30, mitochondrial [Nymphon striatum]|nr:28S ribosomal protein S30, mitochondrial [Nymphon striatum]
MKKLYQEEIKNLPTIEQKLHKFCELPKRCYLMVPFHSHSNPLPSMLYCTRTHPLSELPNALETLNVDVLYEKLKPHFINAIKNEYLLNQKIKSDNKLTEVELNRLKGEGMIRKLSRILVCGLSSEYPHLWNVQVDTHARIDAFWNCEFHKTRYLGIATHREDTEFEKLQKPAGMTDVTLQFAEHAAMVLRSELPLPEFIDIDDDLCTKQEIPAVKYHPKSYGYHWEKRYPTLVPAVWSGDPNKFSLMNFYTRENLLRCKENLCAEDVRDCIISAGILASYSTLLAFTTLQGFTPFNDVTYPFTTQTVITDGQFWSFFAYQMNTVSPAETNPLRNVCWHTEEMKLFDEVTDNNVVGLNDEVLKILLKCFCQVPLTKDSLKMNLTPYIGKDNMSIKERQDLFYFWERKYSNRPEYREEVPLWKHIYRDFQERMPKKK